MTDLSKLTLDADVEQDRVEDRLPADRQYTLDSGVYPFVIDLAYLQKSSGGALMMMLHLTEATNTGVTLRDRLILTSGDAKGNKNYFIDRTGVKRPMPGLSKGNNLSQLLLGKTLDKITLEEKVIKLWSYEEQKEVPTKREVFTDLVGKQVMAGVLKVKENKRVQNGHGGWEPGPDVREVNEIDKFFDMSGKTLAEQQAGEDAKFVERWKAKFEGKIQDNFKPVAGKAPVAGAPAAPGTPASSSSTKPLFED